MSEDIDTKIAEAVFRQVEEDRILNKGNIVSAVRGARLGAPYVSAPVRDRDDVNELVDASAAVRDILMGFDWGDHSSLKPVDISKAYGRLSAAISKVLGY